MVSVTCFYFDYRRFKLHKLNKHVNFKYLIFDKLNFAEISNYIRINHKYLCWKFLPHRALWNHFVVCFFFILPRYLTSRYSAKSRVCISAILPTLLLYYSSGNYGNLWICYTNNFSIIKQLSFYSKVKIKHNFRVINHLLNW